MPFLIPGVTEAEKSRERMHFAVMSNLVDRNEFNAVKYLYDRLNIIDSKAQGVLTRNGLLLTVISVLGSVKLREGASDRLHILTNASEQVLFGIGFLLIVISTLSSFYLTGLKFDNITEVPPGAHAVMEQRCAVCQQNGKQADCRSENRCALQHVQGLPVPPGKLRALDDYLDTFFDITIARQKLLKISRQAIILATVIFFGLIALTFLQAFTGAPISEAFAVFVLVAYVIGGIFYFLASD